MGKDLIFVKPSPTADSRTCDPSTVDRGTLQKSSTAHIWDVRHGINMLIDMLKDAAENHDWTKVEYGERFYQDFINGFKDPQLWFPLHLKAERHHLNNPDGIKDDVNLVDVIEHLVDNVMAAMARTGTYTPSVLPAELLQKACANTVKLLLDNIIVDEPEKEKKCTESQ